MRTGPSTRPDDRVLARLLPDFTTEDADLAAGLRSLHEPELIEAKDAAASVVLETLPEAGGRIELSPEQADAWLAALNDVRLALGTALDVSEDMPDELPPDDPRAAAPGRLPLADVRAGRAGAVRMALSHARRPSCAVRRSVRVSRPRCAGCGPARRLGRAGDPSRSRRRDRRARPPGPPDEACGVIAGPEGSDRPERFIPMLNAARSPTFYEFDSGDLLRLYRDMDSRDEVPVVIYHSHTATEAYPSRTDIS